LPLLLEGSYELCAVVLVRVRAEHEVVDQELRPLPQRTSRSRERLLADGAAGEEIAHTLTIEVSRDMRHVSDPLSQLGATNRA
jgi:DNA-binding NarL/FixJ family response regulator